MWKARLYGRLIGFASAASCMFLAAGAGAGEGAAKAKAAHEEVEGHGPCFEHVMEVDKDPGKGALEKLKLWNDFLKAAVKRVKHAKKRISILRKKAAKEIAEHAKSIARDSAKGIEERLAALVEFGNSLSPKDARKYVLPLYKKLKAKLAKEKAAKVKPLVVAAKKLMKDKKRSMGK